VFSPDSWVTLVHARSLSYSAAFCKLIPVSFAGAGLGFGALTGGTASSASGVVWGAGRAPMNRRTSNASRPGGPLLISDGTRRAARLVRNRLEVRRFSAAFQLWTVPYLKRVLRPGRLRSLLVVASRLVSSLAPPSPETVR